ncbi:MAG: TRAP transporter large permease [Methylobacteriaceae bacterium]|jgi:C4-dicarboxylate transporter DctM subunit|nr:TRAP transporter large permease [Methylobacteriaceae bacterium]
MITVMLVILAVGLIAGAPVAFAIGISAMVFVHMQGFPTLSIMAQRMTEGIDSFALLALPLFILSGEIMAYGCTPRLMRFANLLLGRVPGGLGATAAVGCGFFGAISGSGVATTAAVGSIIAPEMVKQGYKKSFTASLVAGSGVLGMIIPPSFCMVVYGASGGVSISALFMGGVIPGFACVLGFVLLSIGMGIVHGYMDRNYKRLPIGEQLFIVGDALLPLLMPAIVLGGVVFGVFTPTEAAGVASVYAFVLAYFVYREIDFNVLINICVRSSISTAIIMLIISMSTPFGWILAMNNIPTLFAQTVMSVTENPITSMILISGILLVLGTFMDGTCLIILLTPILVPLMKSLNIDLVHFGMVFMLAIAIGGVTPPLALSLFVSCRIIKINIDEVFPDVLYVIGIMSFVLLLVILVPGMSLYIPRSMGLI